MKRIMRCRQIRALAGIMAAVLLLSGCGTGNNGTAGTSEDTSALNGQTSETEGTDAAAGETAPDGNADAADSAAEDAAGRDENAGAGCGFGLSIL